LLEVNRSLAAMHETLLGLRADLATSQTLALQTEAAVKARPARTRGAG
jgi:hypothetical protein